MNYRHAYHAGNFADLVKHAALTCLLARLTADPSPLTVVDTHAGGGLYDLSDPEQQRSREAEAGVKRLQGADLPPEFAGLSAAIARRNPAGGVKIYPGSPALILDALRPGDRYVACELKDDVHALLAGLLKGRGDARLADGFAAAPGIARDTRGRLFVLVDPPFERPDDYLRIVETVDAVLRVRPDAAFLIWLPLKDLETLDGFVRRLEAIDPPAAVIAETRLRPLTEPMKMNGCALVGLNAPAGFAEALSDISAFVAEALGGPTASAKLWTIGG